MQDSTKAIFKRNMKKLLFLGFLPRYITPLKYFGGGNGIMEVILLNENCKNVHDSLNKNSDFG